MDSQTLFSHFFSSVSSIFWVVFFFCGSIFVHELGHYLAAKKRGLFVERFAIGLGPKLFGWKNKAGTEFCVCLLPIGGYVALPQMSNAELLEGKYSKRPLAPITYTDKITVLLMGAVFNVLFALLLGTLLWFTGIPSSYEQETKTIGYVPEQMQTDAETEIQNPAFTAGLQAGDTVLSVDAKWVHKFSDILQWIATGTKRDALGEAVSTLSIERNGMPMELTIYPALAQINSGSQERLRLVSIGASQDLVIGQVLPKTPAERAGLQEGDRLLSIDGEQLYALKHLSEHLKTLPNGKQAALSFERNGKNQTVLIEPDWIPVTKPQIVWRWDAANSVRWIPDYSQTNLSSYGPQTLTELNTPSRVVLFRPQFENHQLERAFGSAGTGWVLNLNEVQTLADLKPTLHTFTLQDPDEQIFQAVELPKDLTFKAEVIEAEKQALIGIVLKPSSLTLYRTPWAQFKESILLVTRTLKSLVSPSSDVQLSNLMGAPGIARTMYAFSKLDFRLLLWLIVIININLAFFNLLPIPVLDGGHIFFETLSKLLGKPLPARVLQWTQSAFALLLLALMLYVCFFDIRRWHGDYSLEAQLKEKQMLYLPISLFEKEK